MKKSYLLLSFFLVAVFATLNVTTVKSKITSPPAGNSGDPINTQTCITSGCHGGTASTNNSNLALAIGTGNPTTTLNSSFVYTPGQLYNIAFGLTSSTGRYGFQIIPLTASNAMAGTLATNSGTTTTQINTLSGRQYMGHKSANTTKNWAFKWTAPATTGPVTFYYAYNTANADGTSNGDVIYKGSVTINSNGTGINDITDKVSELNIFPNPINNEFSVAFDLKEANNVSSQLYTLDGRMVKELINEKTEVGHFSQQFDVNELPSGIYLVKLNVGDATTTRKIIKL